MSKLPTASSLPRVFECLGSHLLPHVESETEEAYAGTEMHRFLQIAGEHGRDEALSAMEDDDVRADCELINLDALPISDIYGYEIGLAYDVVSGRARELGRGVGRAAMYQSLAPTEIGGTFDVIAVSPDVVFLADFKRGQYAPPAKRNWQVKVGALMASRVWDRDSARIAVIQRVASRSPAWTTFELDALDIAQIEEDVRGLYAALKQLSDGDSILPLKEGPHCRYCPAWNACTAKVSMVRRLASGAEVTDSEKLLPITAAQVGVAWQRLRIAKEMMGRLESAIYAYIEENGAVQLPNGMMLGQREKRGSEVLDGRTAHQVITELHGGDTANAASSFTVTKASIDRALRGIGDGEPIAPRARRVLDVIAERGGVSRRASTKRIEEFSVNEAKALQKGDAA